MFRNGHERASDRGYIAPVEAVFSPGFAVSVTPLSYAQAAL